MRILQIASGDFFSTYGGGQVYVKNLVDTMIDAGDDVVVVSCHVNASQKIVKRTYRGICFFEINSSDFLPLVLDQAKPDVIHAHSMKDIASVEGNKRGIPVVVTSHHGGIMCPAGTRLNCKDEICNKVVNHKDCLPCMLRNLPGSNKVWYPVMRHMPEEKYIRIGKWLRSKPFILLVTPLFSSAFYIQQKKKHWNEIISNCSLMVAPCHEIAEAMTLNGLPSGKIRVVPHGIPLPKKRPTYPDIIDGKVKFYYVGRICYVKGIHKLLDAFSHVDNTKIELHLIGGAGNKVEERYMENLQKKYVGDNRIHWLGKLPPHEIFKATKDYHVSISPSFLEAFGLNIAESLALGKPVLTTCSGGGEMQIKDEVNGWIVPINDSRALADKIKHIAEHTEILLRMSEKCYAISLEDHRRALLDVYGEAISLRHNSVV